VYDDPEDRDVTELSDHLRRLYAAFNARDIDAITGTLHDDVDWPDRRGRIVHGREEVRATWERGALRDARGEPLAYQTRPDGRIAVVVLLAQLVLRHIYRFENGLIRAFEIDDEAKVTLDL
jgi:hypothetical protein